MPRFADDWEEQEAMIGEELARREEAVVDLDDDWEEAMVDFQEDEVVDLDPNRTITHLVNGVPHCYLGHSECYDAHEADRRADDIDWEEDRERRER